MAKNSAEVAQRARGLCQASFRPGLQTCKPSRFCRPCTLSCRRLCSSAPALSRQMCQYSSGPSLQKRLLL